MSKTKYLVLIHLPTSNLYVTTPGFWLLGMVSMYVGKGDFRDSITAEKDFLLIGEL